MDVCLYILKPKTLADIPDETPIGWIAIPMINDYEMNPILTYLPEHVKMDGKNKICTKFTLRDGSRYIADMDLFNFGKFKKTVKEQQTIRNNEDMVTDTYKNHKVNLN